MSFPTALRRRLLDPLGMDAATFDVRPERSRAMVVHGIPMGNIVVRELILRFLASAALPGGGLFGTAEDLLRFGRAMLPRRGQDGPRVLTQARIDEMLREQTDGIPEIRDDGTSREPRYALGWRKRSERSAGRTMDGTTDPDLVIPASPGTATHGGASGTRLWVDPERDLVFVFLTNIWFGDDTAMHEVLRRVYTAWDAESASPVGTAARTSSRPGQAGCRGRVGRSGQAGRAPWPDAGIALTRTSRWARRPWSPTRSRSRRSCGPAGSRAARGARTRCGDERSPMRQ